jgi:hypothetical protein
MTLLEEARVLLVARVAEDAVVRRGVRLSDGSMGFPIRHASDCLPAAMATVLEVDIRHVPDLRLDSRLRAGESPADIDRSARAAIDVFLARRGLRLVEHRRVPLVGRWVGVIPLLGGRPFMSHCLAMSGSAVLFDPMASLLSLLSPPRPHVLSLLFPLRPKVWGAADVGFGFSFEKKFNR